MVEIRDKNHFREAVKFAKTLPRESRRSLRHCLAVLNRIKRNYEYQYGQTLTLCLYPDWVKHSFAFRFKNSDNEARGLNGGLILHGFEETFSVEVNPANGPHWSIHT